MIFTSYYAKMKEFPSNFIPVSISRGVPHWYNGAVYQDLAPSWDILKEYKNSTASEKEKEARYDARYKKEILGKMNLAKLGDYFSSLLSEGTGKPYVWMREDIHVVLLCYEKSEDFCHRKLVSDWLNKHKVPCKEATKEDFEKYGIEKEEKDAEREKIS